MRALEYFYDDRACDAADSIVRTDEYRELSHKEEGSAVTAMTYNAIYKAGLLDGIALGFISATHEDEIKETQRGSFHLGYTEGKAGR
jgi:hypothetical protein